MTANTSPIFTITPKISWAAVTTADAVQDGTSANDVLVFTGNTNGSYIYKIILQPISTSGSTTTNAAAARIYINNGSTPGTAANNSLIKEMTLSAIAVNQTGTTASLNYEIPLNFQIPNTYRIYVGITSFAANTQWNAIALGGDY